MAAVKVNGSHFESIIPVRPSDIDMNQHVHNTMYLDYVLAARYDQMERCYKMSMDEFLKKGWTWWIRKTYIEHKKSLQLGDSAAVQTWVDEYEKSRVKVCFEIRQHATGQLSALGYLEYVMISLRSGRPTPMPQEIIDRYSI
ncbi:acyl-CoA thioesterase [candidate division KSB1 bacterium]|nr:acyl-CoA thioesterase [candidate division KSB1 bacterium]